MNHLMCATLQMATIARCCLVFIFLCISLILLLRKCQPYHGTRFVSIYLSLSFFIFALSVKKKTRTLFLLMPELLFARHKIFRKFLMSCQSIMIVCMCVGHVQNVEQMHLMQSNNTATNHTAIELFLPENVATLSRCTLHTFAAIFIFLPASPFYFDGIESHMWSNAEWGDFLVFTNSFQFVVYFCRLEKGYDKSSSHPLFALCEISF